jgi:hypothetical protein
MTQTIFVLMQHGDDYHGGSTIVKGYNSLASANKNKSKEISEQKPCDDCGHTFFYTIYEMEVED